jgi:dolichyl-phosphate-mannose-protein mannosyltransferase
LNEIKEIEGPQLPLQIEAPYIYIAEQPKSRWYRIWHWEYMPLAAIVIATLIFHFLAIQRPPTIVWDEIYYIPDAWSILSDGVDLRPEHPALAKLFVVAGTLIFGDNAFGWRFFSVVFGTISIFLVYFICKKLGLSWKAGVVATFLFGLENMGFLHAGLALLDVYEVTFLLAGFLLYLHTSYISTGISFALSACCKLVGVFGLVAVGLHWLFFRRDKWKTAVAALLVSGAAFVFFTVLFDYFITGKLENPVDRLQNMFFLTGLNKFTDPPLSISSRPWTWIYPDWIPAGWTNFIVYSYDPQFVSFVSFTVQMLILPTMGYMIYKARNGSDAARFIILWFIATYVLWMSDIITNRVTFVFYFLPTTPAICIGLGMAISDIINKLRKKKFRSGGMTHEIRAAYTGIGVYLVFHAVIFVLFNPAIPTIIKTWMPPWTHPTTTITVTSSLALLCVPLPVVRRRFLALRKKTGLLRRYF